MSDIRAAQSILNVASVQVSLSPIDDENLRNGVAEYCRDNGIRLIAYRPLGGVHVKRLARDRVLSQVAAKRGVSNEEVALAWLMSFGEGIVPIPGATRIETASSISRALNVELDDEDRDALDAPFSGRLLRVPRAQRRASDSADGEVVIVMGMPGAGKSTIAREFETKGYLRLNRDALGGSLAKLAIRLDDVLAAEHRNVVLDNTYPTRKSRSEVIETAWQRGVPVRCVWLTTDVANAQINSIHRMLDAHGSLPMPDDIRTLGKTDTRYLGPDAQFRYERTLEPPTPDEGFVSVDARAFVRESERGNVRALILDFDNLVASATPALRRDDVAIEPARREMLTRFSEDGWRLFVHAWRPHVARGRTSLDEVEACFVKLRTLLGVHVDVACCPHDAGPPICWCRKPIPGSVLEFASRRSVALAQSIVVAASAADRTMAERIGARVESSESFFG